VINVPIIYFSVQWWNTLHQGATIRIASGTTTIATPMLVAWLIMSAACWFYSVAVVLGRLCRIIEDREQLEVMP